MTEEYSMGYTHEDELYHKIEMLEKQNVELIGKVAFLENDLNNAKAQIEKMKNCSNCFYDCDDCNSKNKDCDKCPCGTCVKYKHWELRR